MATWIVEPYHKKSAEEHERFIKDGKTITRRTGWRWVKFEVETNDDNPPEFEFDANGQLDINSCYSNNIEEVEMIEVKQGPYAGVADKMRFPGVGADQVRVVTASESAQAKK